MILADLHTHSIASGHGTTDTITDMVKHASSMGLGLLGISDHGPVTRGAAKPSYYQSLALAPHKRFGIELLYGIELNILDRHGTLDLTNDLLSKLDYGIASMHIQNIKPGTMEENTYTYIEAMKNPYVKIIGHCDDVKYPVDYKILVEAACDYHVLLELNNSSLLPNGYRGDTSLNDSTLLTLLSKKKQPILLSSDSHGCKQIGRMDKALQLLDQLQIPKDEIINCDIQRLKSYLL